MDATAGLLRERSVLDISVVEIARKVDTSPATFYHYFKDVEEVALNLAEQAGAEMPALLELMEDAWRGMQGMDTARAIVDAFITHWDAHHAVLQLRNLAADNGDKRFSRIRREALRPVLDNLAAQIQASKDEGRVADEIHPQIAAAAMASILERLSAHYRELGHFGATREQFVETCARILYQTVTGRSPR